LLNTIEFLISKKRFEDIKVIRKELIISSRSIDLILNNLLNLGRGKDLISERKDPISLLQLANRLNEIYGTLAKVKNIHFNIECFRDITLYVNEGALQICLQNLVDNAVKYAATEVNVRLNYHLVKQMFVVQVNNDIHPENRERINALLAQLKGKKEVLPGEFGKSLGLVIISRTANRLGAYIRPRLGKRNRLELRLSFKAIAK
jgi:signal transduction histidine kinase